MALPRKFALIGLAALFSHTFPSTATPTQRCNTAETSVVLMFGLSPDAVNRLTADLNSPK